MASIFHRGILHIDFASSEIEALWRARRHHVREHVRKDRAMLPKGKLYDLKTNGKRGRSKAERDHRRHTQAKIKRKARSARVVGKWGA
jgi:hypothetical protein